MLDFKSECSDRGFGKLFQNCVNINHFIDIQCTLRSVCLTVFSVFGVGSLHLNSNMTSTQFILKKFENTFWRKDKTLNHLQKICAHYYRIQYRLNLFFISNLASVKPERDQKSTKMVPHAGQWVYCKQISKLQMLRHFTWSTTILFWPFPPRIIRNA